ncbi:MAG TPA: hypothetical protein DC084_08515, partial [Cupriavidus sp.]|nr:hypothetical protein [Cupriavidus sp.]
LMLAAGTTAIAAATITFNGALLADTCVVNAGAGDNVTVTLPAVQASILTTNGQTGGETPCDGCDRSRFSGIERHQSTRLSVRSAAPAWRRG